LRIRCESRSPSALGSFPDALDVLDVLQILRPTGRSARGSNGSEPLERVGIVTKSSQPVGNGQFQHQVDEGVVDLVRTPAGRGLVGLIALACI